MKFKFLHVIVGVAEHVEDVSNPVELLAFEDTLEPAVEVPAEDVPNNLAISTPLPHSYE